jgi:Leucine-rich repeat (LRR) protein
MVSVPVSAVVINFPAPGLAAAIRNAIGKTIGDIHDTDLIGLTSLDAGDREIANLEGIQYCTNLTELLLYRNQIRDISTLSGLSKLTVIWLVDNEIVDISALVNN